MTTRIGTAHFSSWTAAFRYYQRQDIDKEEVVDRVANGSIAIGPPDQAEGLRIVTDEDGRYHYEETIVEGFSLLLHDTSLAYGKTVKTVECHEQPQWFKDYMKKYGHEFTKGFKNDNDN